MLPKFKVEIILDQEALTTSSGEISGTVASQYTYGKSVEGVATVTALCKGRYYYYRPLYYGQVGDTILMRSMLIWKYEPTNHVA